MSNQLLELEKTLENQLVLVKEMRLIKSDVSKMKPANKKSSKKLERELSGLKA